MKTKPRSPEPAAGIDPYSPSPTEGLSLAPVETFGRLTEGSRFGVYVLGACIGEGGMARVYRAEHEGLQRQVALKVLIDGVGHDGEAHERFLREARLAAAIKHPNVVNIFDVGVCEDTPYLVMELLEGVDLDALVESKGKLDEATIIDVMVPIVAGLAAVHEAGIVHRDLKPGNIFLAHGLNDELEPKLLDFGISKSIGPDHMKLTSGRGMMIGTPFYMSPEGARGAEVTALSDQYALGVVMYECAAGSNPFAGANNFGDVVNRVSTGTFESIATKAPQVSKRLTAIIERAMQLDPARRFPDMRAMGRELLQLAGQRTRITWGLTFNELATQQRDLALLDAASQADATLRPASKRLRWSAAAVVALAGLGAMWLTTAPEETTAGGAASTISDETAAASLPLRAPPAASEARTELSKSEVSIPIARAIEDRAELATAPPSASEPSERAKAEVEEAPPAARQKSERPSKVRSKTVRRATPKRRPKPAPPREEELPPADWIPTAPEVPVRVSSSGRGTNNAPILD